MRHCCLPRVPGRAGLRSSQLHRLQRYDPTHLGIPLEKHYPYRAGGSGADTPSTVGICSSAGRVSLPAGISAVQYGSLSLEKIQGLLASSPVLAAIWAPWDLRLYVSGVYECPGEALSGYLNHVVQIIGYGQGYYLIKNSWGRGWGAGGFGNITAQPGRDCGITMDLSGYESSSSAHLYQDSNLCPAMLSAVSPAGLLLLLLLWA